MTINKLAIYIPGGCDIIIIERVVKIRR